MDCFSDSEPTSTRGLKPAMIATTTTAFGLVVLRGDVEAKEKADSGGCFADVVIQPGTSTGGDLGPKNKEGPRLRRSVAPRESHIDTECCTLGTAIKTRC